MEKGRTAISDDTVRKSLVARDTKETATGQYLGSSPTCDDVPYSSRGGDALWTLDSLDLTPGPPLVYGDFVPEATHAHGYEKM
ncbi:uncharacterized protein A4U43_C07F29080 [Asparagus officinalis]|uniref:Uncharacterized protein n=1 Tax=Asparagus officinalis TaxID=4686 RepID=A0A5P1EJD8_ASPOF|nr:uncharacterized protein A4U43_C07F29080 [Asparagus officinalis]